MISIISNTCDFIEVSLKAQHNKINRFPNQMIWDVNSYLMKQYRLYECYFSSKPCETNSVRLPKIFLGNRYLCFSKLDQSYISAPNFNENEFQEEYLRHQHEFLCRQLFYELYCMECIDDLNYVATSDLQELTHKLSTCFREKTLWSKKSVRKAVALNSEVLVHIGDHCDMTIHAQKDSVIKELLGLIEPYRHLQGPQCFVN